ncbi:MAG: mechanosensitive ion channel family protein [Hyphomicrobiales bacterium]
MRPEPCRQVLISTIRAVAFCAILSLGLLGIAEPGLASETGLSPLSPPDTTGPGATLKSFRDNAETAYRTFYESRKTPIPKNTPAQARLIRTLDTSQLPVADGARLAAEAAILLNEVLDRVRLPAYDEIPDAQTLRSAAKGRRVVYRIPDTDIVIAEIEEGPRKGEFLFSAETVDRAHEFYEHSRSMKPQPGAMKSLYRQISVAPGHMLSRTWIERLPDWAKDPVLDQAVWKWVGFAVIIGIWALALMLPRRYVRSRNGDHRYWRRFYWALGAMGLTYCVRYLLKSQIILIGTVFRFVDFFVIAAFYVLAAVALINLGRAIARTIITSRKIDPKKIDAHLINVSCRAIAWALVVILLAVGASRLGIPIEAVIAGLGVGGLAAALAARPTLENLIAGVTLYLDKPVRVGEFCQFGDVIGSIEEIGLRSTRIRQWGGSLISVPNSQFADYQLINYDNMNYILFRGNCDLRLGTTPDQLRVVLAKLREMLFAHPKVNWPRVRLVGFGEHCLKIQLLAYADTVSWSEYHAIREDIYMRTLEIIDEAGTHLAVPVQIIHQAPYQDIANDKALETAAEEQVNAWREAGELPFPDMSVARREELSQTLDYPPRGSVDYEPTETPGP